MPILDYTHIQICIQYSHNINISIYINNIIVYIRAIRFGFMEEDRLRKGDE